VFSGNIPFAIGVNGWTGGLSVRWHFRNIFAKRTLTNTSLRLAETIFRTWILRLPTTRMRMAACLRQKNFGGKTPT
jgi:hypothetical protein